MSAIRFTFDFWSKSDEMEDGLEDAMLDYAHIVARAYGADFDFSTEEGTQP